MHGHTAQVRQSPGADGSHDLGMGSHLPIMHFALSDCKRLLRHEARYAFWMDTPNARLRRAREKYFETAKEAALSMGVPVSTYIGHENGRRGFPASRAPQYAKKFKTSEEWLLYGKGEQVVSDPLPSGDELQQMIAEIIESELTLETKLADLARILGPALHDYLERYVADRGALSLAGARRAREEGAQSHAPTRQDAAAESRSS